MTLLMGRYQIEDRQPPTRSRFWMRQLMASVPNGDRTFEQWVSIIDANWSRTAAQLKTGVIVPA